MEYALCASNQSLKSILESSGGTLNDIVQLIVFIVNVQENGDLIGKIVSNYCGNHLFTSTVVGVVDLITDSRLIIEMTAVAYI